MGTRTGHFEADGADVNLNLGFVPAYIRITNVNAADTEVITLEWWAEMGDSKEIWYYKLNNDGGDDIDSPVKNGSGGYVAEYDTTAVDTGTEDSDTDPVRVTGGQGVTISAAFMDDGDEVYYIAFGPNDERDVDHGDINA